MATTTKGMRTDKLWVANNNGAALMAKGQYQDAFLLLRSAIEQTADPSKLLVQEEEVTHDSFAGIGTIPLSAPRVNCVQGDCELHHDVFPLPFAIYPQRKVAIVENDRANLIAGTAVALFNMALSRHRQFLLSSCPTTRRQLLSETYCLYKKVHHMMAHIEMDPDDPVAQLYLVSCCNLVHVCAECGALDAVRYWKNELLEALVCVSMEHPGGTFRFLQRVCAYYCSIATNSAAAA